MANKDIILQQGETSAILSQGELYNDACSIIEQAQVSAYRSVDVVSFFQNHPDFFQLPIGKSLDMVDDDIFQSLTGKSPIRLSWTHYSIILQEITADGRAWYENEAANEMWSTRTLQRNVSSQYYHRLLQSQNKSIVRDEMKALTAPLQDKLKYAVMCRNRRRCGSLFGIEWQ